MALRVKKQALDLVMNSEPAAEAMNKTLDADEIICIVLQVVRLNHLLHFVLAEGFKLCKLLLSHDEVS